ncbi:MAG: DsbA family protein [Paracoccaceae bacterium]
MQPDRRALLALTAALPILAGLPAALRAEDAAAERPDDYAPATGDIVYGDADAPLTVIEYANFTCPACASFHEEVFPALKEKYIEPGQVKFVLREVYANRWGLWAAMTARCGGERGYYAITDQLFRQQDDWTRAEDAVKALKRIGRTAGLSSSRLDACFSDQAFGQALLERYQANMEEHTITGTPNFVVDGEVYGPMGIERFSSLIDEKLSS